MDKSGKYQFEFILNTMQNDLSELNLPVYCVKLMKRPNSSIHHVRHQRLDFKIGGGLLAPSNCVTRALGESLTLSLIDCSTVIFRSSLFLNVPIK